jgi:hypothetical protein
MFKYIALLLLAGCGAGEFQIMSQPIPPPPQYSLGEVVYVRSAFCRGRIIQRNYDMYVLNPVLCADGSLFYNVVVNSHELSR